MYIWQWVKQYVVRYGAVQRVISAEVFFHAL